MARGRPRLKCDNCFYGKPGKCEYPYPGAPCLRCQEQRLVCGGIPARDAPTPPGKVRPLPRPPGRPKKDPSATPARRGRPPKTSRPSLAASESSTPAGADGRPLDKKPRINLKLRLPVPAATSNPPQASQDASSGLSGPDDDDSDDEELLSSESDDPDDRAFRPSYVPRGRPGDPSRSSRASRGSPFVTPAPDVDRTTRSALANVSSAPRIFFKRGPLPPQPGPISNKRPRGGNPVEFFQARGAQRDILSEDGSSNEVEDLEKMGLYLRPPPVDPSLIAAQSASTVAEPTKRKRRSEGTGNRLASLLYGIGDDAAQPSGSGQSDGRRSATWVSLRVPSPVSRPPSPPVPVPSNEAVLHYMGLALAAQKTALLQLVVPSIADVFALHNLTILSRHLEHELATTSHFDIACYTRAKQMIVRGFDLHDETTLAAYASGQPPPSASVDWPGRCGPLDPEHQPSLVRHPPQTLRDKHERTFDPYVAQLARKILGSLIDAICTTCSSTAGLIIDGPNLMQTVVERKNGEIAAAVRAEAYRQDRRDASEWNVGQYQSLGTLPLF